MSDTGWSKVLGRPGFRVYQLQIDEVRKPLKLWVRRKSGDRKLVCSGCGRKLAKAYDTYEREVRDLLCFEFRTTVVVDLYRVRCPDCGVKTEKVPQLPSKAPFSTRFEEAVGLMARCRRLSTLGYREKLLSDRCLKAVTKPHFSYLVDSSAGRNFLEGACFARWRYRRDRQPCHSPGVSRVHPGVLEIPATVDLHHLLLKAHPE